MSLPNGYFEVSSNWAGAAAHCYNQSPAFVRGRLVTKAEWSGMNASKVAGLFNKFPRWIFYGGPIQTRDFAEQWSYALYFWAQEKNLVWIPDPAKPFPCIVSPTEIAWPVDKPINWASVFRWVWVHETEPPLTLYKGNNSKWYNQPKGVA